MRNVCCKFYTGCLSRTVNQNLSNFDCSECVHKSERVILESDADRAYVLLRWSVFRPDLWKKYLDLKAVDGLKR